MVVNKPLVIKLSLAATKAVTEKIKSMIESSRIQVKKLIKLEDDYQGALYWCLIMTSKRHFHSHSYNKH